MALAYWKLTDPEYRDLYNPEISYYPNTTIEALDNSKFIVYRDIKDVMRSIFVDRWPYRLVQVEVEEEHIVQSNVNYVLCSQLKVKSEESLAHAYGPNGEKIVGTINRVSKIEWFSAVGTTNHQQECEEVVSNALNLLSLGVYPVKWIQMEDLPNLLQQLETIDGPLWSKIEEIRIHLNSAVQTVLRKWILSYATDGILELLLSRSIAGATKNLPLFDEKIRRIASGAVMYIVSTSCAWDTLGDLPGGWKVNPFDSFVKIFEFGHWPLGIINDTFYIL